MLVSTRHSLLSGLYFALGKIHFNSLSLCQFRMVCDFLTDLPVGCTKNNKCEYAQIRYWAYQPEALCDERSVKKCSQRSSWTLFLLERSAVTGGL